MDVTRMLAEPISLIIMYTFRIGHMICTYSNENKNRFASYTSDSHKRRAKQHENVFLADH